MFSEISWCSITLRKIDSYKNSPLFSPVERLLLYLRDRSKTVSCSNNHCEMKKSKEQDDGHDY